MSEATYRKEDRRRGVTGVSEAFLLLRGHHEQGNLQKGLLGVLQLQKVTPGPPW